MVERPGDGNPYLAPAAESIGEPAFLEGRASPVGRTGIGYYVILLLNCLAMLSSYPCFAIIGDSYAPLAAVFYGAPLLLAELLLGLLPAGVYCGRNLNRIGKTPCIALLVLAVIATLIVATADVLAWTLPRTRGGGC